MKEYTLEQTHIMYKWNLSVFSKLNVATSQGRSLIYWLQYTYSYIEVVADVSSVINTLIHFFSPFQATMGSYHLIAFEANP